MERALEGMVKEVMVVVGRGVEAERVMVVMMDLVERAWGDLGEELAERVKEASGVEVMGVEGKGGVERVREDLVMVGKD